MNGKDILFLTGDESRDISHAYNEAICAGMIEKNTPRSLFRQLSEHETETYNFSNKDQIAYENEAVSSLHEVANLFRSEESRQQVIKRWFGECK